MAKKNSDTNAKFFLSESGSIYEDKGNGYVDIDNKYNKWNINLSECTPLSLSEFHYYKKFNKDGRISLFKRNIFQQFQNVEVGKYYKIKVLNEIVEVKIIDKRYKSNEEFCIKYMTKDKAEVCKEASFITNIEEIGGWGSNIAKRYITRNDDRSREKSIVDGFYIVTDKLSTCDSGSIIRVKDGFVIDREISKPLNMIDIESDKLDEIEEDESIYLLKYQINERIEKHKNKIFNKIKELNIGDECYYKNDFGNIYIVKQINIEDKAVKLVLQLKDSSRNKREIDADAFDIELIENSEFYILINAKHPHQIGTLFRVENEIVKTFPEEVVNHYPRIQDMKLRKINIFEANFLKLFPINKRLEKVNRDKFKRINVLSIGDKCFVKGKEFFIDKKYFLSNQLKFDLSSQKYPSELLPFVDASEISLKKKSKNVKEIVQSNFSSMNRQIFDTYEIKYGSVKFKVIKPLSNCEIDKAECDISQRCIALQIDYKQIFAKLLWKGMISQQICIGCEMLSDVINGTDGTFNDKKLFSCNSKNGVLIPLKDNVKTCEKENFEKHLELNANEIIKENDICCLKEIDLFESSNIKIGDNIIYNKANSFSGICKWIGLINGKECVAVVSDDNNSDFVNKSHELAQYINTPYCDLKKVVMFQISYIPPIVNCKPINLDVINPYLIGNINKEDSIPYDKFTIIKNKNNSEVVKLLWKGTIDGKTCLGCEIHSDWPHGTNGSFKETKLFECRDKSGVLIEIGDEFETCESKDYIKHRAFNEDQIIKEDDICCLKCCETLSSKEITINSNLVGRKDTKLKGRCEWMGYINGEECVGISCEDYWKYSYISLNSQLLKRLNIFKKVVFVSIKDVEIEKLHFIHDKIVDLDKITTVECLNFCTETKVHINCQIIFNLKTNDNNAKEFAGVVKWTGMINHEKCVGLDMEDKFEYGMDGIINENNQFKCMEKHGLITLLSNVKLYKNDETAHFLENGVINPNKIITYEDKSNYRDLCKEKIKINESVIVSLNNGNNKLNGTLRCCGLMNKSPVCVVELNKDHESGTNGRFWRSRIINCPDKRAIAVNPKNILKYIIVEKLYFVEDKIVDLKQIFSIKSVGNDEFKISIGAVVKVNWKHEGKSMIGEVKWTGIINNEKCVGLDMVMKHNHGMNGYIDKDNKFVCEPEHGLVTPLDFVELYDYRNILKTFPNGLINPNQYIKFEDNCSRVCQICSKNKNVFVKLLGRDDWLKGAIRWHGEMNKEQVAVIELEENHENGTNGKFWRNQLFTCQRNRADRAVATRWDNIHKYIPLKYHNNIFVENTKSLQACNITKENDKYKVGEVIKINTNPIIYGEVSFFTSYYDQHLVGIIVHIDSINLLGTINGNLLFQSQYFDTCCPGIIVKIESIVKCKEELKFNNGSRIIDTKSVVCKIFNYSNKFCKEDVVKLNTSENNIFYIIIDLLKLNGEQCVEVDEAILSNGDKFYLREIDICKINKSDWEMKYFQYTIIDPSSIITLQRCRNSDLEIGNKIKFYLNETYELFEGVIKFIGKANNILSAAVQLVDDNNYKLCKYSINQNETFNSIRRNSNLPIIFLPLSILKLQDICEYVNGIPIVDPRFVKKIEGMKVENDRKIIFLCEEKRYFSHIKWKGKVDKKYCLGCEIDYPSEFGTDGKFGDKILFTCPDKHGILIPTDSIDRCCEIVGHQVIDQYDSKMINADNICCIRTDPDIGKYVRIYLNDQIKRKDDNKYPICRWLGYINNVKCVGVDLNYYKNEGTNGTFCGIRLFQCKNNYGALYRLSEFISKKSDLKHLPDIGLDIVDSFNIKSIEHGKPIEKSMNHKCKDRNYVLNIKWRGCVDGELCIGCELNNDCAFGTDGTFAGEKIFNCVKGKGVLIHVDTIYPSCEDVINDINIIKQNFSRFYFASNDVDLKYETMKKLMTMKDNSILKSIISCPENPIDLDIHHDLLQILINENEFEIIKLLLHNCINYNSCNDAFLNLSNIALSNDDDELFDLSVDKCTNKNAMLENGETFLTNLFKKNYNENIINKIIDKKIFDTNITNKNNELPLILACERVMVSTIEKIVNNKPLYTYHKNLALKMIADAENKLSQMNRSIGDIFKIIRILSNVPTNNSMECSICFDNDVSLVFQCGHLSCDKCIEKLFKCPFCDQEIKNPIRIYLN